MYLNFKPYINDLSNKMNIKYDSRHCRTNLIFYKRLCLSLIVFPKYQDKYWKF